jgi:ankyrin repeat protein
MKPLWLAWQESWRRMEQIALRRGWECFTHRISPPADPLSIERLEQKHGLTVPAQLREALTGFSACVQFGWRIPSHIRPPSHRSKESLSPPTTGGLGDALWDIEHIEDEAIANFNRWRAHHANRRDESEAPNSPEMWEGQFPFAALINGDMLTIDCSAPSGPQPVRYFSCKPQGPRGMEGLHGSALAPDFESFITEYSALGCAGGDQADWFAFCEQASDGNWRLDADGPGGRAWREWLTSWPRTASRAADEPPRVALSRTRADRELLEAARANALDAAATALDRGAAPDCCLEGDWDAEFVTPLIHAVRHNSIAMMELLASRGATVNTRRLPLGEAAVCGTPETVRWLIAHGARPNGWKDDQHWPLHCLIERRGPDAPPGDAADHAEAFLTILNALLDAGADPDAPWDNGMTMLMRCGPKTAARLLAHGASPNRGMQDGRTALHLAGSEQMVRLLVAHGGEVNGLSRPEREGAEEIPLTPLQSCLSAYARSPEAIAALLELGADPRLPDGEGRNALWYCRTMEDMETLLGLGCPFDPSARGRDGGTMIHNLCRAWSYRFGYGAEHVRLLDFLTGRGVDVNARDGGGKTVLQLTAKTGEAEDAAALARVGAK